MDLFVVDPGDTIIWQRCMRLKGLENTMSRNELESQHLKAWFTKFDKDNSKTLDQREFGFALNEMGFKYNAVYNIVHPGCNNVDKVTAFDW